MNPRPRVLIVDDQPGDIAWLLDRIRDRGYDIVLATNKAAAKRCFDGVASRKEHFVAAIIDVMVAIADLTEIEDLDDDFFEESHNTGIDLCRYVRQDLKLSADEIPIAVITVRDDKEVYQAVKELGVPLFDRAQASGGKRIDAFLDEHLPKRSDKTRDSAR